jgi:hypothetical protein
LNDEKRTGEERKMSMEKNIGLVIALFMACMSMAFILPQSVIAGSLEPPPTAVDGSGNPVPTTTGFLEEFRKCDGVNFIDQKDGTVYDCVTRLVWIKEAIAIGELTWAEAISKCDSVAHGQYGLEDNSVPGDWHLPNTEELESLVDPNRMNWDFTLPALRGVYKGQSYNGLDIFGYISDNTHFWSSNECELDSSQALAIDLDDYMFQSFYCEDKTRNYYVWCVRNSK